MKNDTVEAGIDTICYACILTSTQKDCMLQAVKGRPGFQTKVCNYWKGQFVYTYSGWAGVRLRLRRSGEAVPWELEVIAHPARVLGNPDRSALYVPQKDSYREFLRRADAWLEESAVPCALKEMQVRRADYTQNHCFSDVELVQAYLRILKKSRVLPHYRVEEFREEEGKTKDVREANRHSYKQSCKSAAFFAYDKTAQLAMLGEEGTKLKSGRILRLEVQLRRKALRHWIPEKDLDSGWKTVKHLGKQGDAILQWYWERLQPGGGSYVRYQTAWERVETVKGKKLREQMCTLLRRTSDSQNLETALEKCRKQDGWSRGQIHRVLEAFKKLGIHPITLPNHGKWERLEIHKSAERKTSIT